jgi:hypothetical protein
MRRNPGGEAPTSGQIRIGGRAFDVDFDRPQSLGLDVGFDGQGPTWFDAGAPRRTPYVAPGFTGSAAPERAPDSGESSDPAPAADDWLITLRVLATTAHLSKEAATGLVERGIRRLLIDLPSDDGAFLLSLQLPAHADDAVQSRPVLHPVRMR